ncbi:MAG: guanylate kinase [Myxococcales bacterium]|nr:guanylate kinase [Myxococcales bacterium]
MSIQRGSLVIISSPSGAGKTTLSHKLLGEFVDAVKFSVSYTTRPIRHSEVDGVDYNFVTEQRFEEMVDAGEFAEWAIVHGNRYGTSRAVVEGALTEGHDVVFDVDWQGGQELSKQWPSDALMIFVLPPDLQILEERLRRRATDAEDVIDRRLKMAIEEIGHHDIYPHKIVNDDLEEAYSVLRAVYLCRRWGDQAPKEVQALVAENHAANVGAHADRLTSDGSDPYA